MPLQDAAAQRVFRAHLGDLRAFDRELAGILRDASREAGRVVRLTLPEDAAVGERVRLAQYKLHKGAIDGVVNDSFSEVNTRLGLALRKTAHTAAEGMSTIDEILGRKLTPALRQSFIAQARASIETARARLISRRELSSNVYRTRALANGWVDRAINRGILLGKSASEIARDVAGMISPSTPGGVSFAARRLARTELNNAFHEQTSSMAQNRPWVNGMKWNLSSSHPRPDPCDEYANHSEGLGVGVFKPRNVPDKPHPQCLCYLTIMTIDEDEFVNKLASGKFDKSLAQLGIT